MKNYKFKLNGQQYDVDIVSIDSATAKVNVNGMAYEVEMENPLKVTKTPTLVRPNAVPSTDVSPSTARTADPAGPKGAGAGIIKSPLPGKVLDIMVKPGDKVHVGQTIVCLEAMKMENNINSDREGVVIAIHTQKGDTVLEGDKLIEIG
jgi:glutaconyl-CoA/methylmalonyl-CoA decarboxylase subunit gamma